MEDRYVFLRTTEKDGHTIALIGDSHVLGAAGIDSLRRAFAAHAAPLTRAGVLPMSADQLRERLPELEKQGMQNSVAAFQRALQRIDERNGKAPVVSAHAPAPQRLR